MNVQGFIIPHFLDVNYEHYSSKLDIGLKPSKLEVLVWTFTENEESGYIFKLLFGVFNMLLFPLNPEVEFNNALI